MKLALVSLDTCDLEPPLGLAYMATYLRKYANFYDTSIIDKTYDDVMGKILKLKPDLIGISAFTIHYQDAIELSKEIKEKLDVPIFIGGVHISSLPYSLSKYIDIGILGEGEQTLIELLNAYEKYGKFTKDNLKNIKGLIFRDDDKLVKTGPREVITPLDSLPIPDRSLFDKRYFRKVRQYDGTFGRSATMLTLRGCPFRCIFCATTSFWNKIRFNSPEYILEEVRELQDKYKAERVNIHDDLFTTNRPRMREIATLFKKEKIDNINFSVQGHAATLNDEVCQLLKDMNVKWVGFGFEHGNERMLKYLKQGSSSVEHNRNAIRLCNKYDLLVTGSIIFGSPTETIGEMRDNIRFIEYAKQFPNVMDLWTFVMTPFPDTPIWEVAKERGKVSDTDMDWNLLSHQNINDPMLLDPGIDRKEFKKIFLEGRKRLKYFKMKRVKSLIKNDPMRLVKQAVKKPRYTANLLLRRSLLSESKF